MMDNKRDILVVEGLSKNFGGIKAVDDISFSVRHGEVLGIIGDNGAGKSTLIKMISGVYEEDKGRVYFKDTDITRKSTREIREMGIETIYQDLALADNLDASVNIFLGRELIKNRLFNLKDTKSMIKGSKKTLEELGFELPDMKRIARDLSGGQRQGVAIARAVHWQARLLIMDEPTAALDMAEVEKVYSLIKILKKNEIAVILITHNLLDIFAVADRVIILRLSEKVSEKKIKDTNMDEIVNIIVGE